MTQSVKDGGAAAAEKMKEVGTKLSNKFKAFFD